MSRVARRMQRPALAPRALATLVLLLAVARCASRPRACVLYLATTLPLTPVDHGRKPVVPALLGDKPLSLVVDTGSDETMLTTKAATEDAHLTGRDQGVVGVGGFRVASSAILRRLQLGRLHGGIDADVLDFDLIAGGKPRDGLLGMNLLGAYDVDLDLPGRELRLYATEGDCAGRPRAALAQPLYTVAETSPPDARSPLTLNVTIHGKTYAAIIDTGSPGSVVFANAARRIGLTGDALADDPVLVLQGVGRNKARAHIHRLDEIAIGDLALRSVPVAVLDQDGRGVDILLGMDFISRIHLWLSHSARSIVMQMPPAPSPPLAPQP